MTLGDERLPFGAFFRTADADIRVRILMLGIRHSLNVATAGGAVTYELLRRRRQAGRRGPS